VIRPNRPKGGRKRSRGCKRKKGKRLAMADAAERHEKASDPRRGNGNAKQVATNLRNKKPFKRRTNPELKKIANGGEGKGV
jgi:hypothetical protein